MLDELACEGEGECHFLVNFIHSLNLKYDILKWVLNNLIFLKYRNWGETSLTIIGL